MYVSETVWLPVLRIKVGLTIILLDRVGKRQKLRIYLVKLSRF
jgi:hypothetical protein